MGVIKITGIKLYAYHGCFPEENIIGGDYIVDVTIEADFEEAAINDDLSKTVDYDIVYAIVKEEMKISSKLIEHVARRIAVSLIHKIEQIESTEVIVTKINPPVNGEVEKVSALYVHRRQR